MSSEDHSKRYLTAMHAMQTGVSYTIEKKPQQVEPKHLRVGVNAAMVDHSGLVKLLLDKGIITEEEYLKAIADAMEEEAEKYRQSAAEIYGPGVKLA
jgi:hypothetical protein